MIDTTLSHCYGIIVKNDEYAKILSQITDGEKYDEFIDELSRPIDSYDDNTDYFIGFQDIEEIVFKNEFLCRLGELEIIDGQIVPKKGEEK